MKILFLIIFLLFILSCSEPYPLKSSCNFSSNTNEPERCFGGIGDRCNKGVFLLAPMILNHKSCTVSGYMSIGSIEHDKCCIKTLNKGYKCAFPEENTKKCIKEWNKAVEDTFYSSLGANRQWKVTFGPYPANNSGDYTSRNFYAPQNTKVDFKYKKYCQYGCKKDKEGKIILSQDICGTYCICKLN